MGHGFSLTRLQPVHRILVRDLPPEQAARSRILTALARSANPVLRAFLGQDPVAAAPRFLVHERAHTDLLRRLRERARRLGARCDTERDLAWLQVDDLAGSQPIAMRCVEAMQDAQIEPLELEITPRGFALLVSARDSDAACSLCFEVIAAGAPT